MKEEIEKAREESESKHLNNEKNYIDNYLKEYSDKLNDEISEKVNMLTEAKEQLDNMVKESFDNLENSFNDAVVRFEEETSNKILEAIDKLEKETESVLFKKYMSALDERIHSVNEKLDNETSNLKDKYEALSSDFDEAIDIIKNSIIDRDELISLHNDERNAIVERFVLIFNSPLASKSLNINNALKVDIIS